eukprot:2601989-Rhodomonas_salina.1
MAVREENSCGEVVVERESRAHFLLQTKTTHPPETLGRAGSMMAVVAGCDDPFPVSRKRRVSADLLCGRLGGNGLAK